MATAPHTRSGSSAPAGLAGAPSGLRELLALAVRLAREAGGVHAAGRRAALRIETKSSPTDLVSQVDREAERLIVDQLARLRPNDALLAEEGALSDGASGVRWIIDPLDGTTNYVYGYPAYCVSIAVEVDDEPCIGVIYDSSAGALYQAVAGFGAVCDGRPIKARRGVELGRALVATGFSYLPERRRLQGRAVTHLLGRIRDIRRGGSAALDLCRVATGQVDAFYELYLNRWDYAAGAVIAQEAGAEVVLLDTEGERQPAALTAPTRSATQSHAAREHSGPVTGHRRGAPSPAVVAAASDLLPALLTLLREAGALKAV